jgi:hypothetical protein
MSDRLRDEIRSAIAQMTADTPEPLPYGRVVQAPGRPAMQWAWPAWALASFVVVLLVVGVTVWLRPGTTAVTQPAPTTPSVATSPDSLAVPSVFVAATHVPTGFDLVDVDVSFGDQAMLLALVEPTKNDKPTGELLITTSTLLGLDPRPDFDAITQLVFAAYPAAKINETRIRGQRTLIVTRSEVDGWTTAVLTLEKNGIVSEVRGAGVDQEEVLDVAKGLVPLSHVRFVGWAASAVGWDLQLGSYTDEPTTVMARVRTVPGIASATLSTPHIRTWSAMMSAIRTFPFSTPTTDPGVEPEDPINVTVDLEPGADLVTVAGMLDRLGTSGDLGEFTGVDYSPANAETVAKNYMDAVLSKATLVSDDPVTYQASAGPEPVFDTSSLGAEMPLDPHVSDSPISTLPASFGEESFEGPIIDIGTLDDGPQLILVFLDDKTYIVRDLYSSRPDGNAPVGFLGSYRRYGRVDWSPVTGGGSIVVWVPLTTSVVSCQLDDGTRLWQRPVGGYAIFWFPGVGGRMPHGTITALDADGSTIDQWSISTN